MSLGPTCQRRGSWRSGCQWTFSSDLSHGGCSESPNPSLVIFPVLEYRIGIGTLSNWQIFCIGCLTRGEKVIVVKKVKWKPVERPLPKNIVHQKQNHIRRRNIGD